MKDLGVEKSKNLDECVCQECLGKCPLCGDEIHLFKTQVHKRLAKWFNEDCGQTIYALPKRGTIEISGCVCSKNNLPVRAIIPNLKLQRGDYRRQESKVFFWTNTPCFSCRHKSVCTVLADVRADYE